MYSKPEIILDIQEWQIGKKNILEITIDESMEKPHFAEDENGKWLAYIRHHDQNLLANGILINYWKRLKSDKGTLVRYKEQEKCILDYLKKNESITIKEFSKLARIPFYRAEKIICNLLLLKILKINISENGYSYSLG
jgi:predicted HTH transcriptional regulator